MHWHLAPVLLSLLALACGCARGPEPVAATDAAAGGWRLVVPPGVKASLTSFDIGPGAGPALRLSFAKAGPERRFIALEGKPQGAPSTAKALAVGYRLTLDEGSRPKLALLVLEKDGGAWFRTGTAPLAPDVSTEVRLPLEGFVRAEFAQDADPEPRWDQAERFQVGLVLDGPAAGTLELGRVAFTGEPFQATAPLPIPCADPALWSIGKDRAAQCRLVPGKDGPAGQPSLRIEFAFPGRRHMYVTPALRLQDVELAGYRGLRFFYKARLPAGIAGLLVTLTERGDHSQYYAHPAPPASDEWVTMSIAFSGFRLGEWSKDDNARLDLGEVESLVIGVHGVSTEPAARGWITVSELELAP